MIVWEDAQNCAPEMLVPQFSLSLNWISKTESAFEKYGEATTTDWMSTYAAFGCSTPNQTRDVVLDIIDDV